ncbi:MAG TPA: Slp family lipoprotein [Gammaproteobacteria bacterium]|nr:Slp family lipoprotein [Gammaproteobacteria bacterium]
MRPAWLVLTLWLLSGCASTVPVAIREPVPASPALAEVRKDLAAHVGREVRWGGTIAAVENRPDTTVIEVVGRRLHAGGRPRSEDRSAGRFLVVVDGFLDPAVYGEGRQVTARGTLAEPVTRDIGRYAYRFPVVEAGTLHLWPLPEEPRYDPYPPPWYHDPWYPYPHPYYPYW